MVSTRGSRDGSRRRPGPAIAALLNGGTAAIRFGHAGPGAGLDDDCDGAAARSACVHGLETRRVAGVQGSFATDQRSGIGRALRDVTDLLRLTRPSVASGSERRVKTFWEVATTAGLRTAVVNWWATWPAPADAGLVVSDRATLRLEKGGTSTRNRSARSV